jgi:DNA invertase Pin-like site-specific DNA recombinase
VDIQKQDLVTFVKIRGFDLIDSYFDEGISGSTDSRPELNRLMADARRRRFDTVIVWKLDRFGRSLKHLVNTLDELKSVGVSFISYKESLDLTTAAGELMFHVIAAMAQFERTLIQERTKAGVAFARSKGKSIGRPRVTKTSEKRLVAVDVSQIARLKLDGLSNRAIGHQLGIHESTVRRYKVQGGASLSA